MAIVREAANTFSVVTPTGPHFTIREDAGRRWCIGARIVSRES
jgi:hypothetical protein